jgi:hypothetical protein
MLPNAETVGDVDVAYKHYDKPPPSGKNDTKGINRSAAAINI